MTQEEKAKAYDEAKARMRKAFNSNRCTIGFMWEIFPEFKGENEDEKIRKELLEHCKNQAKPYIQTGNKCPQIQSWITWLEKQGKETSWKPSKEEMDVLYGLAYITNQYDEHKEEVITRLYQDLKREFFNGLSYENMFPNTEDGVRRRSTIQVLEYARSLDNYNQFGKADIDKNIAWLEKQYEQKTNDKVEPKFKEDDWVVNNDSGGVYQVIEIRDDEYCLWPLNGEIMGYLRIIDVDNDYHLWTIEDAKDGDVLAEDTCTFIIKKLNNDLTGEVYCCLFDDGDFDLIGSTLGFDEDSTYPATKEQRDFLFAKIKEAGYEWNAEKKELKKVEENLDDKVEPKFKVGDWINNHNVIYHIDKISGVYVTLSTIDGTALVYHISVLDSEYTRLWTLQDAKDGDVLDANGAPFIYKKHNTDYVYCYCGVNLSGEFEFIEAKGFDTWNNNYKVYPATKEQRDLLFAKMKEAGYEWNAEKKELKKIAQKSVTDFSDIRTWKYIVDAVLTKELGIGNYLDSSRTETIAKELQERFGKIEQNLWSEEDKRKLNRIYSILGEAADAYAFSTSCRLIGDKECIELQDFLKSIVRQNTWKPSDEQMIALRQVISGCSYDVEPLLELETKLKNLKFNENNSI